MEESLSAPRQAAATARRHGISNQLLFAWRKAYREGRLGGMAGFVPAMITPPGRKRSTHPPGTAAEGVEVWYCSRMALDTDKIDEAVLALLFLTRHDHWRAWKGFDWDALSRLYDKGLIADPVNKAKSVAFTEEGLKRAEVLFQAMFTKPD